MTWKVAVVTDLIAGWYGLLQYVLLMRTQLDPSLSYLQEQHLGTEKILTATDIHDSRNEQFCLKPVSARKATN